MFNTANILVKGITVIHRVIYLNGRFTTNPTMYIVDYTVINSWPPCNSKHATISRLQFEQLNIINDRNLVVNNWTEVPTLSIYISLSYYFDKMPNC